MLSKSMLQRREWARKYNLSNKVLYDLFSEFMSILQLSHDKYRVTTNDPFSDVFPVDAN